MSNGPSVLPSSNIKGKEEPNHWNQKREREKIAILTAINQCTSDLNSAVYHLKEVVPLNDKQNWETINDHDGLQYICPFKWSLAKNKIEPKTEDENISEYNTLYFNACFAKAEKILTAKLTAIEGDIKKLDKNIEELETIKPLIEGGLNAANHNLPLHEQGLSSKQGVYVRHYDYSTIENLQQAVVTNTFDIHQAEGLKLRLEQELILLRWRIEQLKTRRKVWIVRDRLLGVWQELLATKNGPPDPVHGGASASNSDNPDRPNPNGPNPNGPNNPNGHVSGPVPVGSFPLFSGNNVPTGFNFQTPNKRWPPSSPTGGKPKKHKVLPFILPPFAPSYSTDLSKLIGKDGIEVFDVAYPEWIWVTLDKSNLVKIESSTKLEKISESKHFGFIPKEKHAIGLTNPNDSNEIFLLGYSNSKNNTEKILHRIETQLEPSSKASLTSLYDVSPAYSTKLAELIGKDHQPVFNVPYPEWIWITEKINIGSSSIKLQKTSESNPFVFFVKQIYAIGLINPDNAKEIALLGYSNSKTTAEKILNRIGTQWEPIIHNSKNELHQLFKVLQNNKD